MTRMLLGPYQRTVQRGAQAGAQLVHIAANGRMFQFLELLSVRPNVSH